MRKASRIREKFTFSDCRYDDVEDDDENRLMFCLSCGEAHRHGNICPFCQSDAQDTL